MISVPFETNRTKRVIPWSFSKSQKANVQVAWIMANQTADVTRCHKRRLFETSKVKFVFQSVMASGLAVGGSRSFDGLWDPGGCKGKPTAGDVASRLTSPGSNGKPPGGWATPLRPESTTPTGPWATDEMLVRSCQLVLSHRSASAEHAAANALLGVPPALTAYLKALCTLRR